MRKNQDIKTEIDWNENKPKDEIPFYGLGLFLTLAVVYTFFAVIENTI